MTDRDREFQALHEFAKAARSTMSPENWDYLIGGADTETTLRRNRLALDRVAFRPRVLCDVEHVDCGIELFGHRLKLPVILAPIGSLQDFVPEGGIVPARAAARFGVLHMLSSVCKPGLEAVAEAAEGYPKIFQLYVRGDDGFVDEHIERAMAAGYAAFCFTVDLDCFGRRDRDIAKRHQTSSRQTASGEVYQERFSWDDVKRARDKYAIPMILKGIATAEDAVIAADLGLDAVYVSNHGGRQLDHAMGTLDVLPEVVDAVGGRTRIIFDGGVMRGTDVVKAMALGADAVGIGRLQGLAAAAGGEEACVRMLEILETEIEIALALLGVNRFADLDASYLRSAEPVREPGPLSAFPLLDEGY